MNDTPQNIQVRTESVQNIANSIRTKNGTTDKYKIGEMSGAIDDLPTYIRNTTLSIENNGVYNVGEYEKASVDVPVPSGATTIITNGRHDVKDYIYADVNVPEPTGALAITTNGQHNVKDYEYANVNVPQPIAFDKLCFRDTIVTNQTGLDSFMLFLSAIDWSQIKICDYMFRSVQLGTSGSYKPFASTFPSSFKPTSCSNMFYGTKISSVPLFDTSLVTSMMSFCNGSTYLVDVPKYNTTSITTQSGVQSMFYGCQQLSQQSVDNVLQMCIDLSSKFTSTLSYLWNGSLPQAISDKAQNSPYYQAFLDSGWTL